MLSSLFDGFPLKASPILILGPDHCQQSWRYDNIVCNHC